MAPAAALSLPDEMVFEILQRLPEKNLNRCKCVSKPWRSLITSPGFVQAYQLRHPAPGLLAWPVDTVFEPFITSNFFYYSHIRFRPPAELFHCLELPPPVPDLLGITDVINGLVCLYNSNHLFLANVFTGEIKQLPLTGNSENYIFGYDAVNGVYKLLGLGSGSSEILSLGLGGWRRIDYLGMQQRRDSAVVNNVLYSVVVREISRRRCRCYLVSFDLNSEKFRCIKAPKGMTSECLLSQCAVKLGGHFALADPNSMRRSRLSLCILEDVEGNAWTKYHVPLPEEFKRRGISYTVSGGNLPNGRVLLFNYDLFDLRSEEPLRLDTPIYSYDHQTHEFEKLFVGRLPHFPEMPSLAPIHLFRIRMLCVEENCTKFDVLFDGNE